MKVKNAISTLIGVILSAVALAVGIFCLWQSVACMMQVNPKVLGPAAHNVGAVTIYEPTFNSEEERTPADQQFINGAVIWCALSIPFFLVGGIFLENVFEVIVCCLAWFFALKRGVRGENEAPPKA